MADTTAADVRESLSIFDINVHDDETLEKMLEIARLFNYDADSIVNEWLAYQSTHGCKLSIENLDKLLLEKTAGRNRSKNNATPASARKRNPLVLYTADNLMSFHDNSITEDPEENDLLSAYGTPNRVQNKQKRTENVTPKSAVKSKPGIANDFISASPGTFSPSTFSPSTTSSQKYTSRSNAGGVLVNFGPSHESITNHRGTGRKISIGVDKKRNISKSYKYMFQKLVDLSDVMDEMIENAAETIRAQNSSDIDVYSPCCSRSQEPIHIAGRICCDSGGGGVGRLNSQSVLLQGDRAISSGKYVPIDLSQLEEFSLFPGQIVVLQGSNPTGKKFIATKVYTMESDETLKQNIDISASDPLSLLIAAGPFTTSDCLSYEPLNDLLSTVKSTRPDVTFIIGPILDSKHDDVKSGKLTVPFEEILQDKLNYIIEAVGGLTHLVIASSIKEASCHPVYPQPPYLSSNSRNVHFVGDPCTIQVEELRIALTSNDILFHLGAEEISKVKGQSDRLGRLAGHVLEQKSFYPLYPSNKSVNVDWIAAEQYGAIPQRPDLAILPSDLKCFIKNIDGCVCINPGRLAKGMTGGTFAQVLIEPADSGSRDSSVEISAQVVKI